MIEDTQSRIASASLTDSHVILSHDAFDAQTAARGAGHVV